MTALRLTCIVPFCARTRGRRKGEPEITDSSEWICGEHWRGVRSARRRVLSRARIAARRLTGVARTEADAHAHDIWQALKSEAIERAAGIGS
jgi:hypothetical protein